MKVRFALLGLLAPVVANAGEGLFGTKTSAVPATGGDAPMGVLPVIQMVLALAIVIAAVKWLMPLALKKFGKRWTSPSGAAIKIEESAAIGPAHVFVVTVRGKTMLLGATAESVTCLADLTAPQKPEEATFRELLERAEQVPSDFDEATSNSEATESPLSDLAQQLDRLRKLGL